MSTNVTIAASSLGTVILRKRIWDLWIPHPWTRNMRIWPRGRVIYIHHRRDDICLGTDHLQ